MKNLYIFLFSAITVLIVLALFYHFSLFVYIAIWLGISLVVVVMILVSGFLLVFLLAIPYYLITKEKEVEEYGNYSLEEVEGKE